MVMTFPAILVYSADMSDFSVGVSVIVLGAATLATGRWLARRAARLALEQFTDVINHIVDVRVTPQFTDMRHQVETLQTSIDDAKDQNARDHGSVVVRLEAVEARLPPPAPPNYPPPPKETP